MQILHLFSQSLLHTETCTNMHVLAFVLVCNLYLFSLCCLDMNNRSIAWWLRQIGLPQYTKTLESEYYGLEVCECSKVCLCLLATQCYFYSVTESSQFSVGLLRSPLLLFLCRVY